MVLQKDTLNGCLRETGFQCIETKKADINEIIAYDVIILGGGIYASGYCWFVFPKKEYQ